MLKDFIKNKSTTYDNNTEKVSNIVDAFEANVDRYPKRSLNWIALITADELKMKKSELCEILEDYYQQIEASKEE